MTWKAGISEGGLREAQVPDRNLPPTSRMFAPQVDAREGLEALAGEEAEPEAKQHAGTPEVVFKRARRLEKRLP